MHSFSFTGAFSAHPQNEAYVTSEGSDLTVHMSSICSPIQILEGDQQRFRRVRMRTISPAPSLLTLRKYQS